MIQTEPGGLLNIRWEALATQALTFVLTVLLLRKYAWKKILGMLEARREAIAKQMESLRARLEEAERAKEEYRQALLMAGDEARAMLQLAVARGEAIAKEMSDSSREEARALRTRALEEIEEERARAEAKLREDMVAIATAAAEKALLAELDQGTQERIMEAVLREIAAGPER
jgi:F-type H+-transporting ATPase subunit b